MQAPEGREDISALWSWLQIQCFLRYVSYVQSQGLPIAVSDQESSEDQQATPCVGVQADEFADLLVLELGASPTKDVLPTKATEPRKESVSADPGASQVRDLIEAMQLWRCFGVLTEAEKLNETIDLLHQMLNQLIRSNLAR